MAVVFFVVAVVAYQLTQLLYFALLPSVSAGRGTGTVSGYSQAGALLGPSSPSSASRSLSPRIAS